jgi:hypothetical protein
MIFSPGLRLVPIMKPGSALPRIQAWRAAIWPFQSFRRGRTGGRTVHSTSLRAVLDRPAPGGSGRGRCQRVMATLRALVSAARPKVS